MATGRLTKMYGENHMAKIIMAKIVMAKIIEFYIPSNFRKKDKWIPPQERGKIIEFNLPTKKSA